MAPARSWVLALASCLAGACAEAYDFNPPGALEEAVLAPPSGGASGFSPNSDGGAVPAVGEPCTRNDVAPCPCEGTQALGQRICVFDMASPTQGFFSDCQGCAPPPEPVASCTDGAQSGAETGIDCGGPDCTPCLPVIEPEPDAGNGGEEPTGPVDDCDGVPEGTECDRDCILPSNTAHCNARGECSCLS